MGNKEMKQNHKRGHHYLFHIFQADKNQHPMPQDRADCVYQQLKIKFSEHKSMIKKKEKYYGTRTADPSCYRSTKGK